MWLGASCTQLAPQAPRMSSLSVRMYQAEGPLLNYVRPHTIQPNSPSPLLRNRSVSRPTTHRVVGVLPGCRWHRISPGANGPRGRPPKLWPLGTNDDVEERFRVSFGYSFLGDRRRYCQLR